MYEVGEKITTSSLLGALIRPCKLHTSKKIPYDGFDTFLSEMNDFWGFNETLIAVHESSIYLLQKIVSFSGTEATVRQKYDVEDVKGTRIRLGKGGFLTIVWKDDLERPDLCLIIEDGSDIVEKIKVKKKQLSAAPVLVTMNTNAHTSNNNQDSSDLGTESGDMNELMKQFHHRNDSDECVSGGSVDVSDLMKEYNNDSEGADDLQINPSTW
jgi:hypothetical protein